MIHLLTTSFDTTKKNPLQQEDFFKRGAPESNYVFNKIVTVTLKTTPTPITPIRAGILASSL